MTMWPPAVDAVLDAGADDAGADVPAELKSPLGGDGVECGGR